MAEINLKRFVDIDIASRRFRTITATRDTAVLFTPEGTAGTTRIISSLTEAKIYYTQSDAPTTLKYLTVFFENGGAKCEIIEGKGYATLSANDISALTNDKICVACAIPDSSVEDGYTKMKALAVTRAADQTVYGINEKKIIARSEVNTDNASVKNFVKKYSNDLGAEMTIAAYLTAINFYRQNTVKDYAFTSENIVAEDVTDSDFGTLQDNNYNVDVAIGDIPRNLGGNDADGADTVNDYSRIVLTQTVTERLIDLLTQKISGNTGISQIYSVIVEELERYRNSGYLTTDKTWTDEDFSITYGGETYDIIAKGTALTTGYLVRILPLSSLTDADKAAHKAPPVYIILADQYGIRKITINGEAI